MSCFRGESTALAVPACPAVPLCKVLVLGHDYLAVVLRMMPNRVMLCSLELNVERMLGVMRSRLRCNHLERLRAIIPKNEVIGISIACGLLTPIVCAILTPVGSVTVATFACLATRGPANAT